MATTKCRIDPESLHAPLATGRAPDPCALVIFGGTGDLARRKLVPALYNLSHDGALPDGVAVIGIGRSARTLEAFRGIHKEATARFSRTKPLDERTWERFAARLDYVSGDVAQESTYTALREKLVLAEKQGTRGNRLSYRTATLPQALTQAQRDAFGAHTYERVDHPERGFVHTSWR